MKSVLLVFGLAGVYATSLAQQTVTETMGTQPASSQSTIAAYEAANGFDQDWLTYSGSGYGYVTNRNFFASSGYAGASGGSWAEIAAVIGESNFIITGLTPSGPCATASTSVSFGAFLGDFSGGTSNSSLFNVSYSSDGGASWTSAGIQTITSTWTLKTVLIPGNSNAVKFSVFVPSFYSTPILFLIDDITITNSAVGCALPVRLRTFAGEDSQLGVRLNWMTELEQGNSHFIVERASDAKSFEAIGRVEGHGNSSELHSYTYLDESATSGLNYYRLKQVDLSGTFEYSRIVAVRFEGVGVFRAYPNPTSASLTLALPKGAEPETIRLYSPIGALLTTWLSNQPITLTNLSAGRYLLQVQTTTGQLFTHWIVKTD